MPSIKEISEATGLRDFLDFQKIEIEAGQRQQHTAYFCRIKSLLNSVAIDISVQIELPHSDKKLSEVEHEIAQAIHEATNPARLKRLSP
jgi:hypothetical protein